MYNVQSSMYLTILKLLVGSLLALPAGSTGGAISRPVSHRVLLTGPNSNLECAGALAALAEASADWCGSSVDASFLQQRQEQIVKAYLSGDQRYVAARTSNDTDALVVQWLQYPGWHNGIFTSWIWQLQTDPYTAPYFAHVQFTNPQHLPAPAALTSATTLRDYAASHTDAVIISSDLSGFSPDYVMEEHEQLDGVTENACLNRSAPQGALHPRTYLLLFYRADVLERLHSDGNLTSAAPPRDWDTLLNVLRVHKEAAAVAAEGGGSPLPKYGLCITTDADCGRGGDVLAAIAASIVQTRGTHQGYVFDLAAAPPAAVPMVNGTAWRHAMNLFRQLLQYNAPDNNFTSGSDATTQQNRCQALSQWFASGECMITIDWDIIFLWMGTARGQQELTQPGMLRVAPLPGSRLVQNPNTTGSNDGGGDLLQCGSVSELCAVSTNHDILYLTSAGQVTAAVDAARRARATCGVTEAARMEAAAAAAISSQVAAEAAVTEPVNRAPYSVLLEYYRHINYGSFGAADLAQGISSARLNSERLLRQEILDMMRQAAAPTAGGGGNGMAASIFYGGTDGVNSSSRNALWNATTFPATPWWPGIGGGGEAISAAVLKPYTDAGLDADAVKSYLQALWHAVNSPNTATDIPSPGMINWFKWALSHAALALQPPNATDVEVGAALLARVFSLTTEAYSSRVVREVYESAIGMQMEGSDTAEPTNGKNLSKGAIAGIVAGALGGLLLLAVVALWVLRRLRGRHHDLLGRVLAPRAGQDTTLLISDVQNSTALWEQLPEEVMDIALKLHHNTFRRLLTQYDGYETGTEGDSFILAFADPASAVAFATACQVDLLLQEWPQELLEQPDGEVVLIDPRDSESVQQATALTGDVRRIAGWSHTGPTSLLSILSTRLRVSSTFRSVQISPQPSHAIMPPLAPSAGAAAAAIRGASMFDLTPDIPMYSGNLLNAGRSRSVDSGMGGPYGGASGVAAATVALAAGGSQCGGDGYDSAGGGGAAATTTDLLPLSNAACRSVPYVPPPGIKLNTQSLNPRGGAWLSPLSPLRSGSCEFVTRPETLSVGGSSVGGGSGTVAGSKLFATRAERTGGFGLNFPPLLPTLRETPSSPWVLPPSSTWSSALVAAFPVVPVQETPAAVLGGLALRSLLVALPSGRLAIVAYRGLRVRMGLHTGLDDPQHIVFNKVASAFKYNGPFADTARCTIDTAPGGMVVLSSQTFARLRHCVTSPGATAGGLGSAAKKRFSAPDALVLYGGHHVLKIAMPPPPARPHGSFAANHFGSSSLRAAAAVLRSGSIRAASALGIGSSSLRSSGGVTAADASAVAEGTGSHDSGDSAAAAAATAAAAGSPGCHAVVRFNVDPTPAAMCDGADDGDGAVEGTALYQAVPTVLSCRLALSGSLVSKRVVQLSSLQAPIGCICVAFMYVVGASTLLTEIPRPAKRALAQLQRLVYRLLGAKGGYLVEGGDGLVLAAFGSPTAAVEWALDCVAGLKKLAWEPELLSHWLCEEVLSVGLRSDAMVNLDDEEEEEDLTDESKEVAAGGGGGGGGDAKGDGGDAKGDGGDAKGDGGGGGGGGEERGGDGDGGGGGGGGGGVRDLSPATSARRRSLRRGVSRMPSMARLGAMATTRRVLERGLRIKVGLDMGMATHSLNEASGRLGYRGKVMNRASRVAGKAAAGQVVCSDACWRGCLEGAAAASTPCGGGVEEGEEEEEDEHEEGGKGVKASRTGAEDTSGSSRSENDSGGGGLVGISLGKVALKGVSAPVELIQCMRG